MSNPYFLNKLSFRGSFPASFNLFKQGNRHIRQAEGTDLDADITAKFIVKVGYAFVKTYIPLLLTPYPLLF